MPKTDPIPRRDARFAAVLRTFRDAIGPYAGTLGLTPRQVASQAADADFFGYVLLRQSTSQLETQALTTFKDGLRRGPAGASATTAPDAFVPVPVPPVPAGVEGRFRALVRQIKTSPNYTASTGLALGIEGAAMTPPNLAAIQPPPLDLSISGGTVIAGWGWSGQSAFLDMIELRVDRADGKGRVLLAYDTTPGYVDATPFPPAPAKWTYTAIYWLDDHPVGQWSDPATVLVVSA